MRYINALNNNNNNNNNNNDDGDRIARACDLQVAGKWSADGQQPERGLGTSEWQGG